ncbi:CU044_2847 family protein [Dactylosporangium sp. CS-033363]|uniref:CU044_2847 family protein n=1 Tax=Dactylosporangium sp. CS-033363 TaxID=3239935 RepID=UPI003D8AD53B
MAFTSDVIQFPVDNGGTAFVDVDRDDVSDLVRAGRASGSLVASASLDRALRQITPAANAIIKTVRELDETPDEVEIGFSVRLSAEQGAIISRAKSDSHFEVRLLWRRPDAAPSA